MPQNWKTYKLRDIAILNYGKGLTAKNREDGDIPVFSSAGLTGWHNQPLIDEEGIVIGRKGSVGTIFKTGGPFFCIDTAYYILKDETKYDFNYLYFLLQSLELDKLNYDSAVPGLNRDVAYDQEFLLPPLNEQIAIASILSVLDDKIDLNLQMNKTLEEMAMTLYKHWFVDFGPFQNEEFVESELGMIPNGWVVKRLEELISFSNGYAFKSKQLLKASEEDCLHVFKMGHIKKGGGLKADGTKSWIKKIECKGLEKYILNVGDILMSMTDMKDNMTILGHTALMNEDNKFIVNQRVGLLRINNKVNVGYPFIYLLTNSYDYIERLRSQANSGVQVNLSTGAIKSSLVTVATNELNEQFEQMTLSLFQKISQNAIENQSLTTLRDTLLPKLINGEVRLKEFEQSISKIL